MKGVKEVMLEDLSAAAVKEDTMSDLISREDAIDAIERLILPQTKGETAAEEINRVAWRCAINCAEEMIGHLPSVEPERKKGKWLCKPYGIIFKQKIWQCSVCGNTLDFEGVNAGRGDANYCPNCGARMDCSEEAET